MTELDQVKEHTLSPVAIVALVGVITIFLYLRLTKRRRNYWKDAGIPYIKPLPIFGSVLDILKKAHHEIQLDRFKKYGTIFGYFDGHRPVLSISDPKILKNIFVKDFHIFTDRKTFRTGDPISENFLTNLEGEDWRRVRQIVTPTFTTGKIKRMMDIFDSCSKVLVNNLKEYAERKESFDAKKLYGAFTMDVIASSAFSTKLDSHNDPNNVFVQKARSVFMGGVNIRGLFYIIMPRIMKLLKIRIFPGAATKFFAETTKQIIEERKRTGQKRNDFLQLLLDTAEEQEIEKSNSVFETKEDILSNYQSETNNEQAYKSLPQTKKTLTFHELLGQCVIFFLAGYETTASTLSSATYHLALNQDVQEKLREEVDEAIRAGKGKLTYEAIQGMKYMDNVISETLRMTPPVVRLERVVSEDYELGYQGVVLPKNALVSIPVYAIHHNEEFYPNPERFDPDRFSPEEKEKRDPYTFLPFSSGPRNCVGMRFALVETKVCLAHIIANFIIQKCPQTKVPIEYKPSSSPLLLAKDITVVMEARKESPLRD